MTSLIILQITSLMCLLYALKIKMYQKNIVGFITILVIFLSIVVSYFTERYQDFHYISISLLLCFIMVYHTYKSWRRKHPKEIEC